MTGSDSAAGRGEPQEIEGLLRGSRAELTSLELDRVRQTVVERASQNAGGKRMDLRKRLVTLALAGALVASSGGAVIAASGGSSSDSSSARSQYCPKTGKPKHDTGPGHEKGGNKCGQDGQSAGNR